MIDITIIVQLRDAGEPIGPRVTEEITLDSFLAGLDTEHQGHVLDSMIKRAFLDEAVFQAAIATIWYGEDE
jgi:hypothetical protein